MPHRKEIRSLTSMCIHNIAENVIYHSQMYSNNETHEIVKCRYRYFQKYKNEVFIEKLCSIYQICTYCSFIQIPVTLVYYDIPGLQEGLEPPIYSITYHDEVLELKNFTNCWLKNKTQLQENELKNNNIKEVLKFTFNKYTKKISLECHCKGLYANFSAEATSHIFSTCENLEYLNLRFSDFNESHFLTSILHFKNLTNLNLSKTSCTNEMVKGIWKTLLNIQELALAYCKNITDECLKYLCKRQLNEALNSLCCENGSCNNLGKKLKILDLNETEITTSGITCALQHLYSLEYLIGCTNRKRYIPLAISALINDSNEKGQPFPSFKLKYIIFAKAEKPEEIQKILRSTTHLEKLSLCPTTVANLREITLNYPNCVKSMLLQFDSTEVFDSMEYRNFLLKCGEKLETLVVKIPHFHHFKMSYFTEILRKCKKLKVFQIIGYMIIVNDNHDDEIDLPSAVENLQNLDLTGVTSMPGNLLFKVLNRLDNLKTLKISHKIASILLSENQQSKLFNLENIYICDGFVQHLSLKSLVSEENNLKEIVLQRCFDKYSFVEKYIAIRDKNNFALSIKNSNDVTDVCGPPWEELLL